MVYFYKCGVLDGKCFRIDENIRMYTHIPPPNVLSDSESSGSTESNVVVKWISVLLSIFQRRFFLQTGQ